MVDTNEGNTVQPKRIKGEGKVWVCEYHKRAAKKMRLNRAISAFVGGEMKQTFQINGFSNACAMISSNVFLLQDSLTFAVPHSHELLLEAAC